MTRPAARKEFRLEIERHGADLVEQDGAAAAMLEFAVARPERPGNAPVRAEELAFDQVSGRAAQFDGDERALAAAQIVERAATTFFSNSRFADDQAYRPSEAPIALMR